MFIESRGRVIDQETGIGVPDLLVELWLYDALLEQPLAVFHTGDDGTFEVSIEPERLEEVRRHDRLDVAFQIYRGNEPIVTNPYPLIIPLRKLAPELEILVSLPPVEQHLWRVRGRVYTQDSLPLQEVIVRVFDSSLEDPLGEAKTDENGVYHILYSTDPLRQARKATADLTLRVYSADREILGQSELLSNASADAEINITIETSDSPLSEYERYRDLVAAQLPYQELGKLTEKKILALARRTGIEQAHLLLLAQSIRLADANGLPDAVFYGILRRDLSPETLFQQPPESIERAFRFAIEQNITPGEYGYSFDEIMQRIERLCELHLPLRQIAPRLDLNEDLPLFEYLDSRGIHSLFDIRNAGGIAHLDNLQDQPEYPAVLVLESHARLSLLPTDVSVNAQLLQSGFASLDEIARTPYDTFITTVEGRIPDEIALQVHKASTVQAKYLHDMLIDQQMRASASLSVCGCKDCENAASPSAYLFDLLDYALRHVKYQNNPITLTFLENYFHQPFRGLPVTCEQMDMKVRQVRISIEVLRKHIGGQYANSTPDWYLGAVYLILLEQLGLDYDELRRARSWDYKQRLNLAKRLMLFLDPFQYRPPDILDELLIDPDDSLQLTEQRLEDIFGLRMTTRDPLDPEPVDSAYVVARIRYLRNVLWYDQDWPANSSAYAHPLIDPDIISPLDMVFAEPTPPGVVRTPNQPIHLWEDRQKLLSEWRMNIREIREHPDGGFDSLITDQSIVNGRVIQHNVGLGITVAVFESLIDQRQAGIDIQADLDGLDLSAEAFDLLGSVWEILNLVPPGPVLDLEWEAVYDILIQRLKRKMFVIWRNEEKALNFTLSPEFFKLRSFDAPSWQPREWRAESEVREQWVDMLRARMEQEQSIFASVQYAISVAEERLLGELRNELIRITALPGLINREKLEALTQRLQIDCEAGTCQMTTRIAQAIETIQGVLFGARHGLLEGNLFSLDAPNFDEEWQWIGAYTSWRAAMQVFLYPENALRPILRRDKSRPFQSLIMTLQRQAAVSPETAQDTADDYTEYFRDVCTLTPVAVHQTSNFTVPNVSTNSVSRNCLVIARGSSGKLYFAAFDTLPAWYLSAVPNHTMWEEIPGLPVNSEVIGFLPYQMASEKVQIALYIRQLEDGAQKLYFTSYDGLGWKTPSPITEIPDLVTTAQYQNSLIPATSDLRTAGINGWQLNSSDRLIPMVVEGTGSADPTGILVIAGQNDANGQRRVGVLRGRDGGLILTQFTTIDGRWNLLPGKPILIWRGGLQRVLVTRQDNALTQLGLLGLNWQANNRSLGLVWQTTDGFVRAPDGTSWQIKPTTLLVAASLDDITNTSLLAVEYETTADGLGWRDQSTRIFPLRPSGQGFQLQGSFLLNNPYHEGSNLCSSPTHVAARRFFPVRFDGSESLLLIGEHWHRYTGGANCTISVYARVFAWRTYWSWQAGRLNTSAGVPDTNTDPPTVPLGTNNDMLPISLPNGKEGALLLPGSAPTLPQGTTRRDLAVIAYTPANVLRVTWQTTGTAIDPATASTVGAWPIRDNDRFFSVGLSGENRLLLVARADGSEIARFDVLDNTGKLGVQWRVNRRIQFPGGTSQQAASLAPDAFYTGLDLDKDGSIEILAFAPDGRLSILRSITPAGLGSVPLRNIGPYNVGTYDIVNRNSPRWLSDRKAIIEAAYNSNESPSLRRYIDEAFFYVPLQLALRLRESGHYTAALDWLRSVYDYEAPEADRKIAYRLVIDEHPYDPDVVFQRDANWLSDPLNPHSVAETRKYSYIRFTLLNIVGCLLGFADAEFTRATAESIARARELYLEALELLDRPEIAQQQMTCPDRIGELPLTIGEDEFEWIWSEILGRVGAIRSAATLNSVVDAIQDVLSTDESVTVKLAAATDIVDRVALEAAPQTYTTLATQDRAIRRREQSRILADPTVSSTALRLAHLSNGSTDGISLRVGYWKHIPAPTFSFCIPPNEIIEAVRSHAELNLNKIRMCRNIAGLETQIEPYALPTAAEVQFQNLNSRNPLPALPRPSLQPLPYRYTTLIERAKQLVELARQIEASMLSSLQSLDQEQYQVLRARQDVALTRAGVRLKDLQLAEANDNVDAAELQRERARFHYNHYRSLLAQGLSVTEQAALVAANAAMTAQFAGLYSVKTLIDWAGAAAPAFGRMAEIMTTMANYERRADEWRFQRDVALEDIQIGQQQVQLAYDRVRISAQDRAIAALQSEQAEAMLDFIDTQKFGNAALYEWMSGVLEQVYRFFLQQATSIAQLAEAQLAFERQEIPPAFIQADYWEPPSNTNPPRAAAGQVPNVRGLTGSTRLLQDIYDLDQYAFQTNRRKLQLSETLSLAQLDPVAFQTFRETGVLPFATPMSLFDHKFPGHYLRLIRRVKTSVIALIPPTQGIRATLATTGTSRVVIGGDLFRTVRLQRGPESVALTAPLNATGLFELDAQPETLVPFEGIGVDTTWEFRLPKAANLFDFNTIADVLITIEYTALNDMNYSQKVLRQLDNRVSADRPFSFRRDVADAWWDLHNPDQTPTPLQVSFETAREDFPANIDRISIQEVVLYFAFASGRSVAVDPVTIAFTPTVEPLGQAPAPIPPTVGIVTDNRISTRFGQWVALKGNLPVSGQWTLSFEPLDGDPIKRQRALQLFQDDKLVDLLLVITYSGRLPPWPV